MIVAVTHVAVIFWPRKPISGPTHEDGMPIVWHNQDDFRQNITCIWHETPSEGPTTTLAAKATSMTSFSASVRPLGVEAADGERSAA